MRNPLSTLVVLSTLIFGILPCNAQEEDQQKLPPGLRDEQQLPPEMQPEQLPFGYVRSIDAMTGGYATANSLELAAEYATMMRNYNQAIRISKLALKKNDDDIDVHKAYAEALEGKLKQQKEKDPAIFNACVREWLIVLRNERGEEKGITTASGRGVKYINKLYEDEERTLPAMQHLKELVGRVPKAGESDAKFLQGALMPAEEKVTGKILPKKPAVQASPTLWMK